jgi:hypothetical protein
MFKGSYCITFSVFVFSSPCTPSKHDLFCFHLFCGFSREKRGKPDRTFEGG